MDKSTGYYILYILNYKTKSVSNSICMAKGTLIEYKEKLKLLKDIDKYLCICYD